MECGCVQVGWDCRAVVVFKPHLFPVSSSQGATLCVAPRGGTGYFRNHSMLAEKGMYQQLQVDIFACGACGANTTH